MENNMAAMREALRTLRQRFDNNVMAYQDRYFKFSGWHWHKKAAEAAMWRDVFHELREACAAALAKPPRNCDRFGSESEMRAAFIAWYNRAYDLKGSKYEVDTCDLKHNIDGILDDYIEWLCSTAEPETEGAADEGE